MKSLVSALRAADRFESLEAPGTYHQQEQQTKAQRVGEVMNRGIPTVQPAVHGVVNGKPGVVGGTKPPASRWPLQ